MAVQSPVVLFIFNRPEPTKQVLRRILEARPALLLIVADGPRTNRSGDRELCEATRELIKTCANICEVRTNFSDVNLGCKRRVASGLDWVFSQVPEAIILEDDCLPDLSFFTFCDELLARYREDARIHMIGGNNFLQDKYYTDSSYYFSRLYHIWGWATWARAWKYYDIEMNRWAELRQTDWVEQFLPTSDMAKVARYFLDETHAGRVDTWDYQWVLSGWLNNACAIVPRTNLVTNIGYGQQATHLKNKSDQLANLAVVPIEAPLIHPKSLVIADEADIHEFRLLYDRFPRMLQSRLMRVFRDFLKNVKKVFR